jgi:hypothetical protein
MEEVIGSSSTHNTFASKAEKVIKDGTLDEIMELLQIDSYQPSAQLPSYQFRRAAAEVIKKGTPDEIVKLLQIDSSRPAQLPSDLFATAADKVIKYGTPNGIVELLKIDYSSRPARLPSDQFRIAVDRVIKDGTPPQIMKLLKRDSGSLPQPRLDPDQFARAVYKVIEKGSLRDILKLVKGCSLSPKQREEATRRVIENGDVYSIVELLDTCSGKEKAKAHKGDAYSSIPRWWLKPCKLDSKQYEKAIIKVIESDNSTATLKLLYFALKPKQIKMAVNKVMRQAETGAIVKLLTDHFRHLGREPSKGAINKVLAHGYPNDMIDLLENCSKLKLSPKQIAEAVEKVVNEGDVGDAFRLLAIPWLKKFSYLNHTQIATTVVDKVIKEKRISAIEKLRDHFSHLHPDPITEAVNRVLARDHPEDIIDLLKNWSTLKLSYQQIAEAIEKVVNKGDAGDMLRLLEVPWLKEYPHFKYQKIAEAVEKVVNKGDAGDMLRLLEVSWLKESSHLKHQQIAKVVVDKVIKQGEIGTIKKLLTEHIDWINLHLNPLEKNLIVQELRPLQKVYIDSQGLIVLE